MGSLEATVQQLLDKQKYWQDNPSNVRGFSTGFSSWDEITMGLHPGEESVLGARWGSGKTAIATQMMFSCADQTNRIITAGGNDPGQIVVFNPEMSEEQVILRYLSSHTGIPLRKIMRGRLSERESEAWRISAEAMKRFDPFLIMQAGMSLEVSDLVAEINSIAHKRKIALVIVDYLQRINGKGSGPYERATDVSRRMKDISNVHQIPLLVLSQLKRPESKFVKGQGYIVDYDERPTADQLRDSGSIEQDADNVLLLHNPSPKSPLVKERVATVYIEKQRNGPGGEFKLLFQPSITRFIDTGEYVIYGE